MAKQINVALIGNPNTGKSSVFNILTGLSQKVGNYPGITVEKKQGTCQLERNLKAHIIDLPGTYSLNASSLDENVVIELLLNKKDKDYPDVAVVIADIENLKRNLLLFTQIKDLRIPTILAINMADRMKRKAISLNIKELEEKLEIKTYFANPYHSWERGTNENTNGLLRRFFPKGTEFLKLTKEEINIAVQKINNRPRKCLNWKTPKEEFWGEANVAFNLTI